MDGELNDQHKNTTPDRWTDREFFWSAPEKTINRWMDGELNEQHKKPHQMAAWTES